MVAGRFNNHPGADIGFRRELRRGTLPRVRGEKRGSWAGEQRRSDMLYEAQALGIGKRAIGRDRSHSDGRGAADGGKSEGQEEFDSEDC